HTLRAMRTPIVLGVLATMLISACASEHGTGSSTPRSASSGPSPSTGSSSVDGPPPPATTSIARPPAPPRTRTLVPTPASQFGPVLFDRPGHAIYTFDVEQTGTPTCYGDCAAAWPPVLTSGPPVAGGTVRPALLGMTARRGGLRQATYSGKPLYFYAH